jgi:hypothetical protein
MLEAVRQAVISLQRASEEVKDDKEVVLEAVKQAGYALQWASEELKARQESQLSQ